MHGTRPALVGVGLLVVASGLWTAASIAFGDFGEAAWCASFGVGFALVGTAVALGLRTSWRAAGMVVAAVPAFHWMQVSIAGGDWGSGWVLLGAGMTLAIVAFLMGSTARSSVAIGTFRTGCVVGAAGLGLLVAQNMGAWTVWGWAEVLAIAGLAVLSWQSRETLGFEAQGRPSGTGYSPGS